MSDKTAGISQSKIMESFSHEELYSAMRDGVDFLDGLHLPGFLLGDSARQAWDNVNLTGNEVTFGIKKAEFTDVVKSLMEALRPGVQINETGAEYFVGKVPVRVKIIHRKYEFLQNLDRKWYLYDEYLFPNPFEKYFKARYIVQ